MLTKRSASASRLKQLLALPLVLVCVFCFTENAFSGGSPKRDGNKITYKGNEFELWAPPADTVMVQDPVSGEYVMSIATIDSFPVKMNDEYVYRSKEMSPDELDAIGAGTKKQLEEKLLSKIKPDIAKLPDGEYSLYTFKIVLDKKGKTVFALGADGYDKKDDGRKNKEVQKQIKNITEKMTSVLNGGLTVAPIKRSGSSVIYMLDNLLTAQTFVVKNHNVTVEKANVNLEKSPYELVK